MNTYQTTAAARMTKLSSGNYQGVLGTNIVPGSMENPSFDLATLVESATPTPDLVQTFDVAEGVNFLIGGVGNWEQGEVSNASMWVKTPSGTLLEPIIGNTTGSDPHEQNSSDPNAPSFYLQTHSDGSILGFVLRNPAAGTWTVGLHHDESIETPAFEINVSTVTTDGMKQIQQAYKTLFDQKHQSNSLAQSNADFPWACVACEIGAFALALLIFIIAAALASLTEESVIVVAIADLFSKTPQEVMSFIDKLVADGEPAKESIKWVLTEMCKVLGAC